MKTVVGLVFSLIISQSSFSQCLVPKIQNSSKKIKFSYQFQQRILTDSIEKDKKIGRKFKKKGEILKIPVVVHVIHNTASEQVGVGSNISDAQIYSQIDVLNEDYRRKAGTKGYNNNSVGADMEIEFFLAQKDSLGNPTTGIIRKYYPNKSSFNIEGEGDDRRLLSSISYFPSQSYLNIWVIAFQDASNLGFGEFPTITDGTQIQGLDLEPTPNLHLVDGIFINYRVFGKKGGSVTSNSFDLGRTATHEVGHWLGLLHTDGNDFCGDDYCSDTPTVQDLNSSNDLGCAARFSTCSGTPTQDMIENYMDYSPDRCMNIFTIEQKKRAYKALSLSPRRKELVRRSTITATEPLSKLEMNVYPNPIHRGEIIQLDESIKSLPQAQARIYTMEGREVGAFLDLKTGITTKNLATGGYILKIISPEKIYQKRILVIE